MSAKIEIDPNTTVVFVAWLVPRELSSACQPWYEAIKKQTIQNIIILKLPIPMIVGVNADNVFAKHASFEMPNFNQQTKKPPTSPAIEEIALSMMDEKKNATNFVFIIYDIGFRFSEMMLFTFSLIFMDEISDATDEQTLAQSIKPHNTGPSSFVIVERRIAGILYVAPNSWSPIKSWSPTTAPAKKPVKVTIKIEFNPIDIDSWKIFFKNKFLSTNDFNISIVNEKAEKYFFMFLKNNGAYGRSRTATAVMANRF